MTAPLTSSYWRQFAASTISNLGDGVNAAAMPLLAISLTDDARLIAGVSFASMLPWLLLSLPAGVWIDRWERRRVMVVANTARACLYATIATLASLGLLGIWHLLCVLVIVGCCEVFFDMSAQAFLPSIVEESQLTRANGLLYAVEVVANSFVGLPLGAWLFVAAVGVPFGINGASFALAAVLIASISPRVDSPSAATTPNNDSMPATPQASSGSTSVSFVAQLREGLAWLWAHRTLRTLAILLGVTNMCLTMGESIFVKFAFRYLEVGPRGYGLLLAAMSAGAIVGGLVGDRLARWMGAGVSVFVAYAIFAAADAVRAGFPNLAVVTVTSIVVALAGTVWNVVTVSYRQRIIPTELFGRVNSAYRFIGTGSIAIGALVGGQVAHHVGLRAPFFLASIVTAVALPWATIVMRDPEFTASHERQPA